MSENVQVLIEDLRNAIVRVALHLDEGTPEWIALAKAVEPLLPWIDPEWVASCES